jgi:hypothetical protein
MPIPSRQIGWSTQDNLLWQIAKQMEQASCQLCTLNDNIETFGGTSGTSGTSGSTGAAGDRYQTTSSTSFTLGTGGTITVGTGLAYTVAQDILIARDINNHQVSMVISYNPTTGVLVFDAPSEVTGSGTYSSWGVNLNGAAGGNGSNGTSGTSGLTGSSGTSGSSGTRGTSGTSGLTGSSGTTGTSGTSGVNGAVGGYLGSFYDTTNQTGVAGAVLTMGLNNSDSWNSGVSIVSGSQITIANPGVYNIAFSAQMVKNGGNTATHIHIWLAQNGTSIPITGSQIGFPSNSVYVVPAWNFFVKTTTANEYFQLKWEINSNVDNAIVMTSAVATGNIPAIPGLIVTVNQVG